MQNFTQVNASVACGADCAIEIAGLLTLLAFCAGYNMQILLCGLVCCSCYCCAVGACNCGYDMVKDDLIDNPVIVTVLSQKDPTNPHLQSST